jgi:hypothetical protein
MMKMAVIKVTKMRMPCEEIKRDVVVPYFDIDKLERHHIPVAEELAEHAQIALDPRVDCIFGCRKKCDCYDTISSFKKAPKSEMNPAWLSYFQQLRAFCKWCVCYEIERRMSRRQKINRWLRGVIIRRDRKRIWLSR